MARLAGVKFLSLLPDPLCSRFQKHALVLLRNEAKQPFCGSYSSSFLVLEFIKRTVSGASSSDREKFISEALSLGATALVPARVLDLISSVSRVHFTDTKITLAAASATQLRELVTKCLIADTVAAKESRRETLESCSELLIALDPSWTVEEGVSRARGTGTFAKLLCSTVHAEAMLLLEIQLVAMDLSEAQEYAAALCDVLSACLGLLAGSPADLGLWATLPAEVIIIR
jgi:hypothetical protein